MKYDLGFGNSVCVRQAFLETYHGNMIVFTERGLSKFDYPDRHGDPELVELTHQVIKRQMGITKKHVFITNGATGAVVIALRAFKQKGYEFCYTRTAPWYLRYPSMINAADMIHTNESHGKVDPETSVILLDIPSNPLGITRGIDHTGSTNVVVDAVYFNRVYMSGAFVPVIASDILCGSYSKLLGLNGLRVGWVATNDDLLAERLKELVVGEYCGISVASTEIIKNTLFDFNWDIFEYQAKSYLDYNRGQWSRLEKFFDDAPVGDSGMFYYGPIDSKLNRLLVRSGITWTKGSDLGTNDKFGRFNLGQSIDVVRQAVDAVVRNDLRPKSTGSNT
jgi:aspartate/methionine/tyrosine aminotransferase